MIRLAALWLVLGVGFYLLYNSGYLILNSKRAVMYVGSKRGKKAKFTSCTGFTRRVIRFKETRTYRFDFDCALTAGTVSVELLDSSKKPVLTLDETNPSAAAKMERGKRYDLVCRFKGASGEYTLDWN